MNPNKQDWEPVILKKRETRPKRPRPASNSGVSQSMANDFDPETMPKVKTSNRSLGNSIQQARCAKGWKQSDLDQKCNLPKGTTQSYESGKAIYKPNEVNKMARQLGVTLPRPGKSKSKSKSKSKAKTKK